MSNRSAAARPHRQSHRGSHVVLGLVGIQFRPGNGEALLCQPVRRRQQLAQIKEAQIFYAKAEINFCQSIVKNDNTIGIESVCHVCLDNSHEMGTLRRGALQYTQTAEYPSSLMKIRCKGDGRKGSKVKGKRAIKGD